MADYKPELLQEEEIDLYELWLTIKKRKGTILITTLVFVLVAGIYLFWAERIYVVENYLLIPKVTAENKDVLTKNIVQALEVITKNVLVTSKRLNFTPKETKVFRKLSVKDIRGGRNLKVTLEITEPEVAKSILDKLVNYLNRITFFSQVFKKEQRLLELQKELLVKNIEDYKKLIRILEQGPHLQKTLILGFDPYRALLEAKSKLEEVQYKLKTLSSEVQFNYLQETVVPSSPAKPKVKLILVVALVTGCVLGVFLAFFRQWLEEAKKRAKKEV